MKIKEDCIGLKMGSKIGFITIEDNKDKFKLYKKLGLDIFEKAKKDEHSTRKGNSKREDSVNLNREDDNN